MKRVPILMYHRISDIPGDRNSVPPYIFKQQMELLWRAGYKTVSLIQLIDTLNRGFTLPDKSVVITFDDGYVDNITNALPIMTSYDFRGTVFPIANWVGKPNDWESYKNKPSCMTMNWDQLHHWINEGMELGSHTCTHRDLTRLSLNELEDELYGSKEMFEQKLGYSLNTLCYPYGYHNRLVRKTTYDAGYNGGIAIFDGVQLWGMNPFALPRIQITSKDTGRTFLRKIGWIHPWLTFGRGVERSLKGRH